MIAPALFISSSVLLSCSKPWHKIYSEYREGDEALIQAPNTTHGRGNLECQQSCSKMGGVFVGMQVLVCLLGSLVMLALGSTPMQEAPGHSPSPSTSNQFHDSIFYPSLVLVSSLYSISNAYIYYRQLPSFPSEKLTLRTIAGSSSIISIYITIAILCCNLAEVGSDEKWKLSTPTQSQNTFFMITTLVDIIIKTPSFYLMRLAVKDKAKRIAARLGNDDNSINPNEDYENTKDEFKTDSPNDIEQGNDKETDPTGPGIELYPINSRSINTAPHKRIAARLAPDDTSENPSGDKENTTDEFKTNSSNDIEKSNQTTALTDTEIELPRTNYGSMNTTPR